MLVLAVTAAGRGQLPAIGLAMRRTARAPTTDDGASAALAWLLESGRHAVRVVDVAEKARAELDELARHGLVVNFDGAYRASEVALYGAFQRAAPAPRGY